jgi:hypothetical protein
MTKVHIATPMYGGNCTAGYASSMLNLARLMPYDHNFVTNESLVTRARNMLAHSFLQSDCTHLLFIDADVAFDAEGVVRMVEENVPLIGGLYAKKYINWQRVHTAASRGVPPERLASAAAEHYVRGDVVAGSQQRVEVVSVGTGLMLIQREVFDTLRPETPVSKLGSALVGQIAATDNVHHFFDTGVDAKTGEFLSEDYAFCQRWRAKGGQVFAAPWVKTIHIGTHHFG